MPDLAAFIDETELGFVVTLYKDGYLVEETLMLEQDKAEYYAKDFMEKFGVSFPPLFDYEN